MQNFKIFTIQKIQEWCQIKYQLLLFSTYPVHPPHPKQCLPVHLLIHLGLYLHALIHQDLHPALSLGEGDGEGSPSVTCRDCSITKTAISSQVRFIAVFLNRSSWVQRYFFESPC